MDPVNSLKHGQVGICFCCSIFSFTYLNSHYKTKSCSVKISLSSGVLNNVLIAVTFEEAYFAVLIRNSPIVAG